MDNKYEGNTNRETWLVQLWIDNERGTYLYWRDRTDQIISSQPKDEVRHRLAEALQGWIEKLQPKLETSVFSDLLETAIGRVEWLEIAERLIEEANERTEPEGDVISVYTRKEAIADGTLVDVSKLAKEAGFRFPVAMTSTAWAAAVKVPENAPCQDETGRLWDVLNVLRFSSIGRNESEIGFCLSVVGENGVAGKVRLKSICGPGDDAQPVITIMLPNED